MSDFAKLLGPYARRLSNMFARGVVTIANGNSKLRTLQIRLTAGETKDAIEHFEPYGFTSEVKSGSEPLAAFFDGDRSHGVVLVVADRRYRIRGMQSGEVALYDDIGQKVYLTRSGIVIDGAGLQMQFKNVPQVSMDGNLIVNGNIVAGGDISDHGSKSMSAMRGVFNSHNHPETPVPGPTGQPNQTM